MNYYYGDDFTYEEILNRELNEARRMMGNVLDIREGSIVFTSLAPSAAELATAYVELAKNRSNQFPDTADTESLEKWAKYLTELERYPATPSIVKGTINVEVPIGERFSLADSEINFVVLKCTIQSIGYELELQCETNGSVGNIYSGVLLPITSIEGLESAEIVDLIESGKDAETDEEFYARFVENLQYPEFGGNIQDYKNFTKSIPGVGAVKVQPVWNGAGTVKLSILDSNYSTPSVELLTTVKETIDPTELSGLGYGLAPIGHVVTVGACNTIEINISFTLTLQASFIYANLESQILESIDKYFDSVAKNWENTDGTIVRCSHINAAILDVPGVLDIENTNISLSGGVPTTSNLYLGIDNIPVRGAVVNA